MKLNIKNLYRYCLLLLAVNTLLFAQNKTVYISPEGSDSNDGGSERTAVMSINYGLELVQPGDTILLLPGRFRELVAFNEFNGQPDKPIYIIGTIKDGKKLSVLDGGAETPSAEASNYWMTFKNSSWISVENMKFENGWTDPIQVENSSYLSFNNCEILGGKRVIYATGVNTHHILIQNCFWDQGGEYLWTVVEDSEGVDGWTSMHHESMSYFNGSIIDFRKTGGAIVIRNNKFINNFNSVRWRGEEGYDANIEIYNNDISFVRDNDFEPETYTYNLHIYHNKSFNVHRNLSVDNVNGGYIYYYGNTIVTDDKPWTQKICKTFWKIYGNARNLDYPLYLFNNSFYGCANAFRFDVGNGILIKHFNNAYYFLLDRGWLFDKWDSSNDFDYDFSNKEWPENLLSNGQEVHGIIGDINYTDPENSNLTLSKESKGIDAGKIMSFPEFDWTQKYCGDAPDIGAYENDALVEGPPFRFRIPDNSKIQYKEKPRIVRHKVYGKKISLYFSEKINTSVSSDYGIKVFENSREAAVISAEYLDGYRLDIETERALDKNNVSILFDKMPVGENGEDATYWASTIRIER